MGLRAAEDNLRSALRGHAVDKAAAARGQYGPSFDDEAIKRLLADRRFVRFPVTLQYDDARSLEPRRVAAVRPSSDDAVDGFHLIVHSSFRRRPDALRLIVARHLAGINYGEIATTEDAELFGATLLDMSIEGFRRAVASLARGLSDEVEPIDSTRGE